MLNILFPVFVSKHPNGSTGPFVVQLDQRGAQEPADSSRVPAKPPSRPRPFEAKEEASPSCGQQVAVEDARTPQLYRCLILRSCLPPGPSLIKRSCRGSENADCMFMKWEATRLCIISFSHVCREAEDMYCTWRIMTASFPPLFWG